MPSSEYFVECHGVGMIIVLLTMMTNADFDNDEDFDDDDDEDFDDDDEGCWVPSCCGSLRGA